MSLRALLSALLAALAAIAWAGEAPMEFRQVITIRSGETVDMDFLTAGDVVVISGTVNGDAYVAAERVLVEGTVKGDLLAAARDVSVTGTVENDVRALAEELTISGSVGRNVTALARKVEVSSAAAVRGGMVAGAEEVVLSGPVAGSVRVMARTLSVLGRVEGNLDALVEHLLLGSGADIRGHMTYKSRTEATVDPGARVEGEITRKEVAKEKPPPLFKEVRRPWRIFGAFVLLAGFFTTLLIGLLAVYLLPNLSRRSSAAIRTRPWATLGVGFLAVFVPPVLVVLLMVTVLGIPLGLLILPVYIASLYFARIFAIFWAGDALMRRLSRKERRGLAVLAGCVIYYLLSAIPIVGAILVFAAAVLGFGAFLMANEGALRGAKEEKAAL